MRFDFSNKHPKKVLSKREAEVAKLVTKGMTNLEIANELCIGIKTVKYHLSTVYFITNNKDRKQLMHTWYNFGTFFNDPNNLPCRPPIETHEIVAKQSNDLPKGI